MTRRRWVLMMSGLFASVVVAGALAPGMLRAQSKPPAAAPVDATASPAKFQAAMTEWKSKIVPAAKKEGEVIWYSCAQATEAEGTITAFNKAYPDIQVSQVLSPGFQLVEKINTESSAGRVQADVYQCGGQSGRTLTWRGLAEDFIPPTALDPNVKWRWPIINKETHLAGVFASVSGLNVNTKLVPADKYPKSYWDLVRDPYWVDLIKRKRVAFTDPRIANIGVYHVYGLKEVNAKEYGEAFIREFAGLKPKLFGFNESGEVARGELHAMLGGPWRVEYSMGTVPITKLCLEPGCVSTQSPLFAVVKNAPHPNAAKVFVDFMLSREYAEWRVQALGNTPARADVAPRPLDDPSKFKLQYAGDDKAERQISEVLKWVTASKLFDY
jgi:iron(III) transport system substrate-binding protein